MPKLCVEKYNAIGLPVTYDRPPESRGDEAFILVETLEVPLSARVFHNNGILVSCRYVCSAKR